MHTLIQKPLVARIIRNRLVLCVLLLVIQAQFFTINLLNARLRAPDDGWELTIGIIDNNLTPGGIWLVPYFAGFALALLVPLWAMYNMPNTEYRQFVLAMMVAALIGYAIYIIFPTYVVKPAPEDVPGQDVFARVLRSTYEADAAASTHNAAPSQHVFYAVLNMCFMIRYRPRPRVFWVWTTLAALICASTLLTMRHNSPDLIAGYVLAVAAYYAGIYLGQRLTDDLGDADAPIAAPALGRFRRVARRMTADTP